MRPSLLLPLSAGGLVVAACATGETGLGGLGGELGVGSLATSTVVSTSTSTPSSTGGLSGPGATSASAGGAGGASTTSVASTSSGTGAVTASSTTTSTGSPTSTTSSTATTSSSSSSSSSGTTCTSKPCGLVPQCGCSAGETCSFAAGATTRSCQPAGASAAGAACSGVGDCVEGTICLGSPGVCVEFCASDADCAATSGICALQLSNGMGGAIPNEMLCTMTCDPTTNSGCPTGTGCQVGSETSGQLRTYTFCETSGTKGKNKVCADSTACLPKFDCVDTGVDNVCLAYCYVNNATCANCVALQNSTTMDPIYIGSNQVGVCD